MVSRKPQLNGAAKPAKPALKPPLQGAETAVETPRQNLVVANFIWVLIFIWILRNTLLMRGREDFDSVDASAALQIVVIFVLAFTLLAVNGRTFQVIRRVVPTAAGVWLFTYSVFVLSAAWSLQPAYSGYRSLEFMVYFISIFVAMSYYKDFVTAERAFCYVVMLTTCLDFVRMFLRPAIFSRFAELQFWHTNSYTHAAGMLLCYAVGEYFMATGPRKAFLKKVAIFGGALTILGTSGGSTIGAFAGLAFVALLYRNFVFLAISAIVIALLVMMEIMTGSVSDILLQTVFHGKTEEQVMSGHGRLYGYELAWDLFISKNPIFGVGFGVWGEQGTLMKNTVHNPVIAAFVSAGALAGIPAIVFHVLAILEGWRAAAARCMGAFGFCGGMAMVLVNNLGINTMFGDLNRVSIAFIALLAFFLQFVYLPFREQATSSQIRSPVVRKPSTGPDRRMRDAAHGLSENAQKPCS